MGDIELSIYDATPATLVPIVSERWLIHKSGRGWYRPNAAGYTNSPAEAGRYTHAEAMEHSHPNGLSGPRDGMTIWLENEVHGGLNRARAALAKWEASQ